MKINIRITGDRDVVNMMRTIQTQIMPRVVKPYCDEYADDLLEEMRSRMHIGRTGNMSALSHTEPTPTGSSVVVPVDYAEDENRRRGHKRGKQGTGQGTPHRFVEPSMKATEARKGPDYFVQKLVTFLNSI